jgi:hypothetical protein
VSQWDWYAQTVSSSVSNDFFTPSSSSKDQIDEYSPPTNISVSLPPVYWPMENIWEVELGRNVRTLGIPTTLPLLLVYVNLTSNMSCETDDQVLADRLSGYVQAYTCYGSVRPFGISTLVAGIDKTGPKLYAIEPSGVYYGYRATASGKGKALAKTELEKVIAKEGGITVKEGVMELARM